MCFDILWFFCKVCWLPKTKVPEKHAVLDQLPIVSHLVQVVFWKTLEGEDYIVKYGVNNTVRRTYIDMLFDDGFNVNELCNLLMYAQAGLTPYLEAVSGCIRHKLVKLWHMQIFPNAI